MADKWLCPNDGTPMRRDVRPFTITYKKHSGTVDAPGWYCDKCGEGILNGKDMVAADRLLHLFKAREEGLLEPKEIQHIRKKLKLSQQKAGEIIGGGPRAFQKYESGALLPSRAISNALALLDHDPAALDILKKRYRRSPDAAGDRPNA